MNTIKAIKPGPKPNKPDGTPDKRRRVTPETKPKHPELKPHKHKPGDSKQIEKTSINTTSLLILKRELII